VERQPCKHWKTESSPLSCPKIISKCFKVFKIRHEKLNLLEKNIGGTLPGVGIGNDFLSRTPLDQEVITRIDKWDCTKF
jgi:hypothetical protein